MNIADWMKKIHAYLADNQTQAFMPSDLASRIRGRVIGGLAELSGSDFDEALDKLVRVGSVQVRKIKGSKYYSYGSHLKI